MSESSSLTASKLCYISSEVIKIKTDICTKLSMKDINNFCKIPPQTIADCSPLKKSLLAEHLLNIISMCEPLSEAHIKLEHSGNLDINEVVRNCITNECNELSKSNEFNVDTVREDIRKLDGRVSELNTTIISTPPSHNVYIPPNSDSDVINITTDNVTDDIYNPTTCVDSYKTDFVSGERSQNLLEFLNNCEAFSKNIENGHSVAAFGYPYKYTGSKHHQIPTDIPQPIQYIIEDICELYPEAEINSCLVNKYCGPNSSLPPHADNEQTKHVN